MATVTAVRNKTVLPGGVDFHGHTSAANHENSRRQRDTDMFRRAVSEGWHVVDLRAFISGSAYADGLVAALEVLRDLGVRP